MNHNLLTIELTMVYYYLILLLSFTLEITHFGKKYTHQDPKKEIKSTEDPWTSLDIPIINEIYKQYWLDFVLLGYAIPDKMNVQTNISSANS